MTDNVDNQELQQNSAPEAPAQEGADLNINDLNAMKLIIDVASARGAFKPNEMVMVGQTYAKLSNFLDTVAKSSAAQKPAPAGV